MPATMAMLKPEIARLGGSGEPESLPIFVTDSGGIADGKCGDQRQCWMLRQPLREVVDQRLPTQHRIAAGAAAGLAGTHRGGSADALSEQECLVVKPTWIAAAMGRAQPQRHAPALTGFQRRIAAIPGHTDARWQLLCARGSIGFEQKSPGEQRRRRGGFVVRRGDRIVGRLVMIGAVCSCSTAFRQRRDDALDDHLLAGPRDRPALVEQMLCASTVSNAASTATIQSRRPRYGSSAGILSRTS